MGSWPIGQRACLRTLVVMDMDAGVLADFARGCAVLGSGGGGPVEALRPVAEQAIEECGPVRVVAPGELPADALVMPVSLVGSPAVTAERIGGRAEPELLRERFEALHRRPVEAVLCSEIGGLNGCASVAWAARLGVPLLDADSMGRAFPRMDQNVLELAGLSPAPAILADEYGRTVVLDHIDGAFLEELARPTVAAFGGRAASSDYPLTAGQAVRYAVPGSVSRAVALGSGDVPEPLITGKISSVRRHEVAGGDAEAGAGDAIGVLLEGTGEDSGRLVLVEARSEFVAALEDGRTLALVPDVIALMDVRTGRAVSVAEARYGLRVRLVALPSAAPWYTEAGLRLAGPAAFGLHGLERPDGPGGAPAGAPAAGPGSAPAAVRNPAPGRTADAAPTPGGAP